MKKIIILFIALFFISESKAQSSAKTDHIQWITLQEALKKSEKNPKKIIIDFYTDWCGWCKKMDKATYENPAVVKEINKNYYAVRFNAEKEGPVTYKGKEYKLVKNGMRSVHELAAAFLNGKMGYPTTTFLNNNQSIIQSIPGYIEAEEMTYILRYFGEDKYLNTPYPQFRENNKNGS